MPKTILTVADIYCGAGGLSAGFASAVASWRNNRGENFDIVYGLDRDPHAVETFNAYHTKVNNSDQIDIAKCVSVTDVTGKSVLKLAGVDKISILIGGPNCQGVSAAGLRNPKDKRNEMFRRFVELVRELKPKWFVMENVPGLTHRNNRPLLRTILETLSAIPDYRVEADVLLAAHFGVPQFRYRVFFIGTRTTAPIRFPKPALDKPAKFITVRKAIEGLHNRPRGENDSPANHDWMEIGDGNISRIEAIEPGEDWRDMPISLLPERFFATRASDQKGTYGRLEWDWPAYTITSSVSNVTAGPFTHPVENRPLSVREAARLQSFEDKHVFKGPIDSQYRQVGNAVPPLLAKAVAEAILLCHFQPKLAKTWGSPGRIKLQLLKDEEEGKASFPTLTPRFPGRTPKWDRKPLVASPNSGDKHEKPSEVKWKKRPKNPFPDDLETLKSLAKQPGNYRAAKRAKAILGYFEGKSRQSIVEEANVSQVSVEKWIAGFLVAGLDGWRAYHTTVKRVVADKKELMQKIEQAMAQVRQASAENGNKRLHMNDYLLGLQRKFGQYSVRELIVKTEKKLGHGIGTVYVGDLLAICGVVLDNKPKRQSKGQRPLTSVSATSRRSKRGRR